MIKTVHHIFYLKKQTKNSDSAFVPIYLRITVSNKRAEISINRKAERDKWIPGIGRVGLVTKADAELNTHLDSLESKLHQGYHSLIKRNEVISAVSLKNEYTGVNDQQRMLISVFQKHNSEIAALVNKEYSPGTLAKYKTSLSHIIEFLNWKYKRSDIDISSINYDFISGYDFFLRSIRNCSNNTVVKYINNLRKIIRICIANGWLKQDPFIMYKSKLESVETVFLFQEEIQRMADKEFTSDRLSQVRDVFLFCCFTGLAYIDVKTLKTEQIQKGVDGKQWIFINRQKTDIRSTIPLLPIAARLIEKYTDHSIEKTRNALLPVLSNQKMNDYLKEIATVCGINKKLTSHVARHTFATTITLSNGVPIESISKMLGHSSIRQTQHYARVLDFKIGSDMLALKKKLARQFK